MQTPKDISHQSLIPGTFFQADKITIKSIDDFPSFQDKFSEDFVVIFHVS
jgi:hypothetical protein